MDNRSVDGTKNFVRGHDRFVAWLLCCGMANQSNVDLATLDKILFYASAQQGAFRIDDWRNPPGRRKAGTRLNVWQ